MSRMDAKNNLETEDMERELPPAESEDGFVESSARAEEPSAAPDELQKLKVERDQLFDRLARLQAEFENYRKRSTREQQEFRDYALANDVTLLLPVLDSLEL